MLSAEAAIMKVKSRKIGLAGLGFPLSEGNCGVTGIDNPFFNGQRIIKNKMA